ncbi:acyl carrier protein [Streptomyces guryensis]|uniref:Acyl carrier protein n=1 Tax=Streptomyces guryensis TaxID=2886947 RepID=A0A9Q3Z8H5_9ACTN|nr:acyl carrier protein [Streptomyces guryensis]MCD9877334.1 acyl carrier protein [Streptomyces guryensis]
MHTTDQTTAQTPAQTAAQTPAQTTDRTAGGTPELAADRAEIGARVRAVLDRRFGDAAKSLATDADLTDALPGFDSLAALEYVNAVEHEFGIEVDFVGDDVRHWFSTLGRTVEYVRESIEDQAA